MKKLILFAALAVFAFGTSYAQDISIGAKGGLNLASLNGDGADEVDGRTTFHIGGVVNIEISELFAIQPEVVYSAQGYKQTIELQDAPTVEAIGKLDYINIPVLADITIIEGLSLQGGPQFGINITSDIEIDGNTQEIADVETLDIAAAIGAQLELPMGLFFQARYVAGLTEIVKDAEIQNSNISLSVGWFFL